MAENQNGTQALPFGMKNYLVVIGGFVVILLGYLLMSTENFVNATEVSKALHVAPVMILLGLVAVGYGIMIRPSAKPAASDEQQGE